QRRGKIFLKCYLSKWKINRKLSALLPRPQPTRRASKQLMAPEPTRVNFVKHEISPEHLGNKTNWAIQ
ncbi:hypothetical protein N9Z70_07300, partial [Mariniblastus sp.]|nr:hypothetical protein [Mariniblastus sp.]